MPGLNEDSLLRELKRQLGIPTRPREQVIMQAHPHVVEQMRLRAAAERQAAEAAEQQRAAGAVHVDAPATEPTAAPADPFAAARAPRDVLRAQIAAALAAPSTTTEKETDQ